MRNGLVLVLALLLIVAAIRNGVAQDSVGRIFADGSQYKGDSAIDGGTLLLPLEDYVAALHLKLHSEGGVYCVFDDKTGDANCPVKNASPAGLYANGQLVPDALVERDGKPWIKAEALTRSLGGTYRYELSLNTVDMVVHKRTATPAAAPVATGPYKVGPDDIGILVSTQHANVSIPLGQQRVELFEFQSTGNIAVEVQQDGELRTSFFNTFPQMGSGFSPFPVGTTQEEIKGHNPIFAGNVVGGINVEVFLAIIGQASPGTYNGSVIITRHNDASRKMVRVPVTVKVTG